MKIQPQKTDNSLSELVYQTVYKEIASGRYKPAQRITEENISASLGISRAPVREGLKRLAEDRLVVLVPRSGCYVADVTAKDVEEVFEIRKRLELMALEYAFDRLDSEKIESLLTSLKHCSEDAKTSTKKAIQLDAQLHTLFTQESQCPTLQELLDKLRAQIQIFRVTQAAAIERARDALNEHICLLEAILAKDKPKALRCLEGHIEHTKQNVLCSLKFNSEKKGKD
jgi:DNA-binding GntR family transcriptional regulator